MSKDHGPKHHGHHEQHHPERGKGRGLHKDWRTWTAVLLMLAAMFAYWRSLDEAESPVREPGQNTRMPADAPPPAAAP